MESWQDFNYFPLLYWLEHSNILTVRVYCDFELKALLIQNTVFGNFA